DNNGLTAQVDPSNTSSGHIAINANGSYTYNPKAGHEGVDVVKFKVCDNGSPSACSSVHNLTLTVTGMVWFVDNNLGSPGDGRLTSPFNALTGLQTVNDGIGDQPASGDSVFLDRNAATDYTGPIALLTGQKLF